MDRRRSKRPTERRRRRLFVASVTLLVLAVLAGVGFVTLPRAVRNWVNRTLDQSPLYSGSVGKVSIHLWRGAYSIEDVRIDKTTGNIPVPFFTATRVDFAIQWDALLHRRVVGRMLMEQPELNFVDAPADGETQTGADGPWLGIIQGLFPFTINRAIIKEGSIHFRVYLPERPLDVYLSEVQGTLDNLTNIADETTPLVSTIQARGLVMDQARFEYQMTLDPFSYRPTFHLAARVLGLDVTRINDLALAYGKLDFQQGWFDFVLEVDAKEGQLKGYAKPLFRNLQVLSISEATQQSNPLQIFWEALVGATTSIFENPSRDQFGTVIPFRGDLSGSTAIDLLATVGNILRNAFVRVYLPNLETGDEPAAILEFGPPEFDELLSSAHP